MDQNVIRTDLLPESLSLGLLIVLALVGVCAWIACHVALRRFAVRKLSVWGCGLLSLPLGTIGSWLVFQALARVVHFVSTWPLFLAAVIGAVSLELVSALYAHEGARVSAWTARCLVACRMAAVALTLLVLMQPVVVGERERTIKERVLVLVDDSGSMQFKDRQLTPEEERDIATALGLAKLPEEGLTRAEMVRKLIASGGDESFLKQTAERYEVDVFRFGSGLRRDESLDEPKPLDAREELFRSVTDITRALELALEEVPAEEVASVILFTDGRHNGNAGVESISRRLGNAGIKVDAVVVGGTVKPFDLVLAAADSPESVFLGDKVRFTVTVSATRADGREAKISLFNDQGLVEEQPFTVEGDEWTKEFKFTDVPKEQGVYSYRISVTTFEGELFADNNERTLDVAVSDDRTNVLLVDGHSRWEYRYLRNLFYGRDKSVHLQDWLVSPDRIADLPAKELPRANAARPFGESESGGWPENEEDWRPFDVIIVGDVGEGVLTEDVVERLRASVEERGALLVVIAGPDAMPYAIENQKFRDLLPIEYQPGPGDRRTPPEDDFVFTLSPAGRGHPVMSQSSSSSESDEAWDQLPLFHWRLPIDGVKAGADVLAYAQPVVRGAASVASRTAESLARAIEEDPEAALKRLEDLRGEQNRHALVLTATRGRGRVLMLTTDSMWRLRSKDGDRAHHRFWGQVMRWGVGEKLRAGNACVRLGTDQLRYGAGEPVKVFARFLDERHTGIDGLTPRVVLRRVGSDEPPAAFDLAKRPDSNGLYECEIKGRDDPDRYELSLECPKAEKDLGALYPAGLKTSLVVATSKRPVENVDITATRKTVERLAAATGGKVLAPSEYLRLNADRDGGSKRLSDRVEYPLWSLPPLFLLIIALLTAEWILRKRSALA